MPWLLSRPTNFGFHPGQEDLAYIICRRKPIDILIMMMAIRTLSKEANPVGSTSEPRRKPRCGRRWSVSVQSCGSLGRSSRKSSPTSTSGQHRSKLLASKRLSTWTAKVFYNSPAARCLRLTGDKTSCMNTIGSTTIHRLQRRSRYELQSTSSSSITAFGTSTSCTTCRTTHTKNTT